MFHLAFDHDPDNPNLHAFSLDPKGWATAEEAVSAFKEEMRIEGYSEIEWPTFVIVEV